MSDLTIEQLIDRLRDRRDHGPNDIHELTYQLACQVRSLREELSAVRQAARHALSGPRP
jgi:hypothetical protein